MLTKAHRQEALSRAYFQAVVASAGLGLARPEHDYGMDYYLHEVQPRGRRLIDTGPVIGVQLKCTTRVAAGDEAFGYDLAAKTYNDLRDPQLRIPCVLVLLVLHADETGWLTHNDAGLTMHGIAYWVSLRDAGPTRSRNSVRIDVPRANVVTAASLSALLTAMRSGRLP